LPKNQPEPYTAAAILGATVQSNRFIERHATTLCLRFKSSVAFDNAICWVKLMRRIRELISSVEADHPSDDFFSNIESDWKTSLQACAQYAGYDSALRALDPESWAELKAKAITHFRDYRKGQLKQGFFCQLNEAFAYEHLVRSGCQSVRILKESKVRGEKTPDISYNFQGTPGHCEVKTITRSDDQLASWKNIEVFPGDISGDQFARWETIPAIPSENYQCLSNEFLRKLDSTLTSADSQIAAKGTAGLIYIVVWFDDWIVKNYKTYRKQILTKIRQHKTPNIRIKIGLQGQRSISKGQFLQSVMTLPDRPIKCSINSTSQVCH
jgi:hypothetical protein